MSDPVFCTASDAALVAAIKRATKRLVFAAPAASTAVAEALASRFPDAGELAITVILDADPEVYRLGYGTPEALKLVRAAAAEWMIDLRIQPGLRIGVLTTDESTLIYSPTPLLVEAGAKDSKYRPNAICINGDEAERVATAAAGDAEEGEIGLEALTPAIAQAVEKDLAEDPPKPFALARAVRVFSSKAQYVELKVENCRFSTRQLKLPEELLDVTDPDLKSRISAKMKLHDGKLDAVSVLLRKADGSESPLEIDEAWIKNERLRIENDYTFVIPNHGRVILRQEQEAFADEVERFEENVRRFRDALVAALQDTKAKLVETIVNEYAPRWRERPPARLLRFSNPTPDDIVAELARIAQKVVDETIEFAAPTTKVIYKGITAESVADPTFKELLYKAFEQKGAPRAFVDSLFGSFDAAREAQQGTLNLERTPG